MLKKSRSRIYKLIFVPPNAPQGTGCSYVPLPDFLHVCQVLPRHGGRVNVPPLKSAHRPEGQPSPGSVLGIQTLSDQLLPTESESEFQGDPQGIHIQNEI